MHKSKGTMVLLIQTSGWN